MQAFLSHAAEDTRLASAVRQLVERCALGQAKVWFSSDTSPTGGVTPGGPWFDQLVERINSCAAFLALITPTSANNLWLHYEAGCAAVKGVPIIPIVAGLSVNDVRLPLSLYNGYNVAQPEGMKTFLMRLYQAHNIAFDEVMLEMPVQQAVREINTAVEKDTTAASVDRESEGDRLLRLVDQRFMDLLDQLPRRSDTKVKDITFSVVGWVKRNGKYIDKVAIDVQEPDSIQDVANALYFKLSKYVQPFTYLQEWVVRDKTLGVNLIMRDFLSHVNASAVLRPGHEYEIILLSKPYDPTKGDNQSLG